MPHKKFKPRRCSLSAAFELISVTIVPKLKTKQLIFYNFNTA